MNDRYKTYTLSAEERENFLRRITRFLERDSSILFAYAHGSFLEPHPFRDLDIALYIVPNALPHRTYTYEMELESTIIEHFNVPFAVDVRIINSATVSFQYQALRGRLLVDRNPDKRSEIMARISSIYLDIAPILAHHTKEAFSRHAQS